MRTQISRRQLSLRALAVALVAAGCGGGEPDASSDPTSADGTTTAATDEPATTTATVEESPATTAAESGGPSLEENKGVITIGSETYHFAVKDGGTCDPDFFGNFRAFLQHVDENGEPVPLADAPGITENFNISLSLAEEVVGAAGGPFGGTDWTMSEEGAQYQVDGARATGTGTFINGDGVSTEGTFEVVCAEG